MTVVMVLKPGVLCQHLLSAGNQFHTQSITHHDLVTVAAFLPAGQNKMDMSNK
jgi:hypothetical protein